jgi:DNA-binding response OmpR family regulator
MSANSETSPKILVVEDDADTREMMKIYLGFQGFTVVVASNGNVGIEVATRETPDLIITDAKMPALDGIAMTRQLRAQPTFKGVPIIIMTGRDLEAEQAMLVGANEIVNKPVSPDFLVAKINYLLSPKQPPAQSIQD